MLKTMLTYCILLSGDLYTIRQNLGNSFDMPSLKKAHSEYANKGFELIISPVRRSGFRSASGFDIVFADL